MSKTMKFGLSLMAAGALLALDSPVSAAPPHHVTPSAAAQPVVTELMTRSLPDMPGKEGTMLLVDYPPGAADPVHRHEASAFVYVLEGSIVMQVRGGKEVTLAAGQTFYEGPNDVHTVGRNASATKPARFVVVLVKKQGVPALIPAE
ncbi:cupin domain-containing protein [Achromobacter aloeverae]|uniref:Cupin n=1 Tax=Achromobacter aloeverae TaxID=1750518 RepID=A0A4Q1HFQ7_9BURK|nr:cupin domain-containing protein [Achromobacter aloeverae]RXN85479.1 cupin [Achromobacter aloeverae]